MRWIYVVILLLISAYSEAQVYFYENFDNSPVGSVPSNWTMISYSKSGNSYPLKWRVKDKITYFRVNLEMDIYNSSRQERIVGNLGRGNFLATDTAFTLALGNDGVYLELISPNINIPPGYDSVFISFVNSGPFHVSCSYDSFRVEVYDGSKWITLYSFSGSPYYYSGYEEFPMFVKSYNITNYVSPALKIRFVYYTSGGYVCLSAVDEITVHNKSKAELKALKAFIASRKICPFSSSEAVAIKLRNFGPNDATNIKLNYQLYKDGNPVGNVVTETLNLLPANKDTIYIFNTKINTELPGTYRIKTWIECDSLDYTPFNNSIWTKEYKLIELKESELFSEDFDKITEREFLSQWTGRPEFSPHFIYEKLGIYRIRAFDTTSWVLHGGRFVHPLGITFLGVNEGPFGSYTVNKDSSIYGISKYLTVAKGRRYSVRKTELYSPCILLDSTYEYATLMFNYHINDDIDSLLYGVYVQDSDKYVVKKIAGRTHKFYYEPWKSAHILLDTTNLFDLKNNKIISLYFGYFGSFNFKGGGAIDNIRFGIPPTNIEHFYSEVSGCPSGQDSLVIVFRNMGFTYINISEKRKFKYNVVVQGPTGTFYYSDSVNLTSPVRFFKNLNILEAHFVEPGDLFFVITKPVFDFSKPGDYTIYVSWEHKQDNTPANNDTITTITVRLPVPFSSIDFNGWNYGFLNDFFPNWDEGQIDPYFGTDMFYSYLIKKDRELNNVYPGLIPGVWNFPYNNNNRESALLFLGATLNRPSWLLSHPMNIPKTSAPIKLVYDIAAVNSTGNDTVDFLPGQSIRIKLAPECGTFINMDTVFGVHIFRELKVYDRFTVNLPNNGLDTLLTKGFTDTIDISQYAGKNVVFGFLGTTTNIGNTSQHVYAYIDNIKLIVPNVDFAPTTFINIPDSICVGQPITGAAVTIQNVGQIDMNPVFKFIYGNDTITIISNNALQPNAISTENLPNFSFNSPGYNEILVIISMENDTISINDTLRKTIFVKTADFSIVKNPDTLYGLQQMCIYIPEGKCDGITWNLPATGIYVTSQNDTSVCFLSTSLYDTIVVFNITRACNGCSASKELLVYMFKQPVKILSIKEKVKIYPNPMEDFFVIETPVKLDIALINLQGKILLQTEVKGKNKIQISSLPSGIYILRMHYKGAYHYVKLVKL